jgi:hypothetical protein
MHHIGSLNRKILAFLVYQWLQYDKKRPSHLDHCDASGCSQSSPLVVELSITNVLNEKRISRQCRRYFSL